MQSWEYFHNRFEPVEETNCLLFESHLRKQVGFFLLLSTGPNAFENQLNCVSDTTNTTVSNKCWKNNTLKHKWNI